LHRRGCIIDDEPPVVRIAVRELMSKRDKETRSTAICKRQRHRFARAKSGIELRAEQLDTR
jgi:hypothetical protein